MKSDLKGYYAELGVQPDATADEIRHAYRRLAKKYHPDTNRSDRLAEERFKRVSEAYRVLSNPTARLEYHGQEAVRTKAKSAAKGKSSASFADVFKQVFRSGFGAEADSGKVRAPKRGKDQRITLELDPVELATGVRKTIRLSRSVHCKMCGGSGVKPGYDAGQCTVCHGLGEIPTARSGKTIFTTCGNCEGTGRVAKEPCIHCAGTSLQKATVRIEVTVPAGAKNGQVITLEGEGSDGAYNGATGDLHVQLLQIDHSRFEVDGANLLYTLSVNLQEAVLGGVVEVPARSGTIKLTLKPGLSSGKVLKIRGKGLPNKEGGYGDLVVRIELALPEKLSAKSRELLSELMKLPEWQTLKPRKPSG